MLFSGLLPESPSSAEVQAHAALVLNVDHDMLLPGPIATRKGDLRFRETDREVLNAHSRYLEIDLNPERIRQL